MSGVQVSLCDWMEILWCDCWVTRVKEKAKWHVDVSCNLVGCKYSVFRNVLITQEHLHREQIQHWSIISNEKHTDASQNDFIECARLKTSPSLALFPTVSPCGSLSATLPLLFFLTLPTIASCLCLLQFQFLWFPLPHKFVMMRSQPNCMRRECHWSRSSESRLWCKHLGS